MMPRLATLLFVVVLGLGLVGLELVQRWQTRLSIPGGGHYLAVGPGQSLRSVADTLHGQGVVPYPRLLLLYGRWSGLDREIRPGEYLLPQYLDIKSLLLLLSKGEVIQYQVTIPEGISLQRTLLLLVREAGLEHVLDGVDDARIRALIAPHTNPEGLFFPDSYRYERGTSDLQVLQRSRYLMEKILADEWATRADKLPYKTAYDALIMASIIEKETGMAQERAEIAGVFVRRLRKKMRLQTDPTVIYGLGSTFDGNLRRRDLKDASNLYNTYRHHGLPPSPIALPSREAIHAALNPAEGDALFFVARGDGGHVFSSTLEAHQDAVKKYQLKRRENYRSSPESP